MVSNNDMITSSHVFRAGRSPYIVFGVIGGGLLICGAVMMLKQPVDGIVLKQPISLEPLAPGIIWLGGFWYWLSRFGVQISEETLSYRAFRTKSTISISLIEEIQFRVGYKDSSSIKLPFCRFEFHGKSSILLAINAKVFSSGDLRKMIVLLAKEQNINTSGVKMFLK